MIATSHMLADELKMKPNDFITATCNGKEYVIDSYRKVATHANMDDGVTHWTLNLRDGGNGNIIR